MSMTLPPQPLPSPDSIGFWKALEQGKIALCTCDDCGKTMHPPLERCRFCGGPVDFVPVSGAGTIHSFIVMRRSSVPGQGGEPYAIAVVSLDGGGGVRLTGRVVGIDVEDVKVGLRVQGNVVPIPGGNYSQPEFSVID